MNKELDPTNYQNVTNEYAEAKRRYEVMSWSLDFFGYTKEESDKCRSKAKEIVDRWSDLFDRLSIDVSDEEFENANMVMDLRHVKDKTFFCRVCNDSLNNREVYNSIQGSEPFLLSCTICST